METDATLDTEFDWWPKAAPGVHITIQEARKLDKSCTSVARPGGLQGIRSSPGETTQRSRTTGRCGSSTCGWTTSTRRTHGAFGALYRAAFRTECLAPGFTGGQVSRLAGAMESLRG
eukprot:2557358-Amphidinium_carterae.2